MNMLEIRLLGPPSVKWKGQFVSIPRKQVRALLFRLAADMQPVARDQLTCLFWSCVPDTTARRDLTHVLTHLRNALPMAAMLQTTADFVFLSPRLVTSDTATFAQIFRRPHAFESREALEEASSLFGGLFLDGFSLQECPDFEEWLTFERSVWEQREVAVLAALLAAKEGGNRPLQSLMHAQHYLTIDPADQSVQRQVEELQTALHKLLI